MTLEYSQPPIELAEELDAVSTAANELNSALATLNFELPPDFQVDQLKAILDSLAALPSGTAEGCHITLEYARVRLAFIRRTFFAKPTSHDQPGLERGGSIDQKLTTAIVAAVTALDAYYKLSSDRPSVEPLQANAYPRSGDQLEAVAASKRFEKHIDENIRF